MVCVPLRDRGPCCMAGCGVVSVADWTQLRQQTSGWVSANSGGHVWRLLWRAIDTGAVALVVKESGNYTVSGVAVGWST